MTPRMLNSMYGTKIKIVEGYPGTQESLLAVLRAARGMSGGRAGGAGGRRGRR